MHTDFLVGCARYGRIHVYNIRVRVGMYVYGGIVDGMRLRNPSQRHVYRTRTNLFSSLPACALFRITIYYLYKRSCPGESSYSCKLPAM